jgi:hypothetical protein
MSGFKIGDRVIITGGTKGYSGCLKVGDTAFIAEFYSSGGKHVSAKMVCDEWEDSCFHVLDRIELKPKWSIYDNTLPWSKLSDKQKGKLLVANINDVAICIVSKSLRGDDLFINNVKIDNSSVCVYRAKPKPVKPEPTMAEMFMADLSECNAGRLNDLAEPMIAKGWSKS